MPPMGPVNRSLTVRTYGQTTLLPMSECLGHPCDRSMRQLHRPAELLFGQRLSKCHPYLSRDRHHVNLLQLVKRRPKLRRHCCLGQVRQWKMRTGHPEAQFLHLVDQTCLQPERPWNHLGHSLDRLHLVANTRPFRHPERRQMTSPSTSERGTNSAL